MTAVTLPAEARRRASRMMNSSIRCSFTGGQVGWMTKTSCPRMESSILTLISPSGKRRSLASVTGTWSCSEMRSASAGVALPPISFRAPHGEASSPAYSTAVVNLPITLRSLFPYSVSRPSPLKGRGRFPPSHCSGNTDSCRAVGDVLGHYGTGSGSRPLAKFDGSDKHCVHPDEGAVADHGSVLVDAVEVGRDRAGADVGVLAEVGVAQVGNVRDLAATTDLCPHELCEAAYVDVVGDLGVRPELGEGAAVRAVADPRVLYIYMRADAALLADHRAALDHREGLDDGVLADGDRGVDECGLGIDDRDSPKH